MSPQTITARPDHANVDIDMVDPAILAAPDHITEQADTDDVADLLGPRGYACGQIVA